MPKSMQGSNEPNRDQNLPGDFYDHTVVPALYRTLDQALPEFGFRKMGNRWEATIAPDGFVCRPERIAVMERSAYWISVVEGDGMTLLQYLNGGIKFPNGKDFIDIIRRAAALAGVDTTVIDSKNLSPAQLERIKKDQEEHRRRAESHRLEMDKQRENADRKAIESAQRLVGQAMIREDRSPAVGYFTKRGRSIDRMKNNKLADSIRYVSDVGLRGKMIGAVIAPVIKSFGVVGCQRIFIQSDGSPIEVDINNNEKPTRKATLGRCLGGACVIGEPSPGEPIVLCEGVETGKAIYELTGWCVLSCISALGLEKIEIELVMQLLSVSQSVLLSAGDLDGSRIENGVEKRMRGQRAMTVAADRLRFALKVQVGEWIPTHRFAPDMVSTNELPINTKSVDWEDVINAKGDAVKANIEEAVNNATTTLTNPDAYVEAYEEPETVESNFDVQIEEEDDEQKPKDDRIYNPYTDVYPKQQLDAAHEYLLAHHGPKSLNKNRKGGLHIVCFSDRIHIWNDGFWVELEGKPLEIIRGRVRRYFRKHCKAVATKESPSRFHYVDANLSKSEVDSITSAVVDEIRIVQPVDDFSVRFWFKPNIEQGHEDVEVIEDGQVWDRVIGEPEKHELPETTRIIPTKDGIIDIERWRTNSELHVIPNTPLLFNLGRIEAPIPINDAIHAMTHNDGGLAGLEEFAWGLCPEWKSFLSGAYKHHDPDCAPAVIREIHKYIGNLLAGDIGYHKGNIALFIGPSGTGKSVQAAVIEALLGKSNVVSSTMMKLCDQFHMRSWIGKLWALFPDMEIGRQDKKQISEQLKTISTGDPVAIDRKYLHEIPNFRLGTRIAIVSNQVPAIPDPTHALIRRTIAFSLPHVVPVDQQDEQLVGKLTSPRSLAGILLLSLIGIKNLDQDGGLVQPKWHQWLIEDMKSQSSEYAEMIEECLEIKPSTDDNIEFVSNADLYKLYEKTCDLNGGKFVPKLHTVIAQLKVCLSGYSWPECELTKLDGVKGLYGLRITDHGRQLLDRSEGGEAGGHDAGDIPVF